MRYDEAVGKAADKVKNISAYFRKRRI